MISGLKLRLIILFAAFVLDLIFGDPGGLPHVVVFTGKLIKKVEDILFGIFRPEEAEDKDRGLKFFMGIILFVSVTGLATGLPCFALYLSARINRYLYYALSAFICFQLFAARSLFTEAMKVYRSLKNDDGQGARLAVSMRSIFLLYGLFRMDFSGYLIMTLLQKAK